MILKGYSIVSLRYLVLCSQASSAKIKAFFLAVNNDIGRMNIWCPAAISMPLGVAYVMAELRSLAA